MNDAAEGGARIGADRAIMNRQFEEEQRERETDLIQQEDNQDKSPFRSEEDLDRNLSLDDPDRMKLTKRENDRAKNIKAAVESLPDLDNLSDLMYAQLAIVCKDDVEDAIHRCYGMQGFRQEYKLVDTYEQGCKYLKTTLQLFPEMFLSFSYSEHEGRFVFVHDAEKFEPKAFTTADMADDWMRMCYYTHFIYFPDVEAIRRGIVIVCDCTGITMRRDWLKLNQKLFDQFLSYYPHSGQCRLFNTGPIMNIFASLLRKLLPEHIRDQFIAGYQYDGRLGDDFLVPTVEIAHQRVLSRLQHALEQRYENEKLFSLK